MNGHGIITVDFQEDSSTNDVMICDVQDIITLVGLNRYNDEENQFALTWPEAEYYQKLSLRLRGEDLL